MLVSLLPVLLFATYPDAPTDLTLTPSTNSIKISWSDNSDNEDGFKIYRDGYLIYKTSRDATSFIDKNLEPDREYIYTIYAFNGDKYSGINIDPTYVKTQNPTIQAGKKFDIYYRNMKADPNSDDDWVGIYPYGSSNDWDNVISWSWTSGKEGKISFDGLDEGRYDLRAFFDNSFKKEASYSFSVKRSIPKKRLIFAGGDLWGLTLAQNFIDHLKYIKSLPFDGFIVQGDSFTNAVMYNSSLDNGYILTYQKVMDEVGGLRDLYSYRDMFLKINIDFVGDLWSNDDSVWSRANDRFRILAKVAGSLGFKGIAFDNEPYDKNEYGMEHKDNAKKMVNFKFPTIDDVQADPDRYRDWEKLGSEPSWIDEYAYRNLSYTFKEHIDKVTSRFEDIMKAMIEGFKDGREDGRGDIEVLVYHTPALSHQNYNKDALNTIGQGLPREHEFFGAIFTGLKRGLSDGAKLYDMGEMYKYRVASHFENSYQFRKYNIAKDSYNDLNDSYQWLLPKIDRSDYSNRVSVGFMVYNTFEGGDEDLEYLGYRCKNLSSYWDIKVALGLALDISDKYVIYYTEGQSWLDSSNNISLEWLEMLKEIKKEIE